MVGRTSNSKAAASKVCQEKCIRENGRTVECEMSRVHLSQETGKGRMTSSRSFYPYYYRKEKLSWRHWVLDFQYKTDHLQYFKKLFCHFLVASMADLLLWKLVFTFSTAACLIKSSVTEGLEFGPNTRSSAQLWIFTYACLFLGSLLRSFT